MLAQGLPTIATRATPPDPDLSDEILEFIPTRDVEAVTEALLKLVCNPQLRDRLSTTGRLFAHRFSWSFIAKQHLDIYRMLQASFAN